MHQPMKRKTSATRHQTVADLCEVMEIIAPTALAQSWDNVGLLTGDPASRLEKVLTCIDLTTAVAREAVQAQASLVLAYHPPIFKPVSTLRADGDGSQAAVYRCVRNGISIYATHTALDAADNGTNDVIAGLCGMHQSEPVEYVNPPGESLYKIAVYVPQAQFEKVNEAMFTAGAGCIGNYSHCSFRAHGQGTFLPGESTHPAIGTPGTLETVEEVRLETIVPERNLPQTIDALLGAHPYEEPAFDIYPLCRRPVRGIGRWGQLPATITLQALARKLKRAVHARWVQIVGKPLHQVDHAVIVVGAAGNLPFRCELNSKSVIITGEIRHHDALEIERRGCTAIALGHWTSERPVLSSLAKQLKKKLPGVAFKLSQKDREPFRTI